MQPMPAAAATPLPTAGAVVVTVDGTATGQPRREVKLIRGMAMEQLLVLLRANGWVDCVGLRRRVSSPVCVCVALLAPLPLNPSYQN